MNAQIIQPQNPLPLRGRVRACPCESVGGGEMTTKPKLMTAEETAADATGRGRPVRAYPGSVGAEMPTGKPHGIAVAMSTTLLTVYSGDNGLWRHCFPGNRATGWERDPDTVRAPRRCLVRAGTPPGGNSRLSGACARPGRRDQVTQQLQPGDGRQGAMWLSYGSKEVWVGNPETTTVTRYRPGEPPATLGEDDILDGGDLLPGFSTPVWRLFRRRK